MFSGGIAARRVIIGLLAASVGIGLTTAVAASPAAAKTKKPATVGLPWIAAQGMSGGKVTVHIQWPAAARATGYQVFTGTTYSGAYSKKAKKTTSKGKRTTRTVSGLKPGTRYCFAVRATNKAGAGSKSVRICKTTLKRPTKSTPTVVPVATFNVCSNAGGCAATWESRVPAIRQRILETKADVIGLQEISCGCGGTGRDKLEQLLAPGEGLDDFEIAHYSTAKAVIYRRDKFTLGEKGYIKAGMTAEDADRGATFAELTPVAGGGPFLFLSVHLENIDSVAAGNLRRAEMHELLARIPERSTVPRARWIFAGDFNSHLNRSNDWPTWILNSAGFVDTNQSAATFTNGRFNSSNQYRLQPLTSYKYGSHVDHVFTADGISATGWGVQLAFDKSGRYTAPLASDHSPVRVTLFLP